MATSLSGRERRRLRKAREDGYLDATLPDNQRVVREHGLWCWRLRLPMVWFERHSRRSRYGRVHLDMMTTPDMLTAAGRSALQALGGSNTSAHASRWEKIPREHLGSLSRAVLRATLKPESRTLNQGPSVTVEFPSKQSAMLPRRAMSA